MHLKAPPSHPPQTQHLLSVSRSSSDPDAVCVSPAEAEPAPPSEDCVRHLVEMGFQRAQVEDALRTSNNDMNMATTLLLQQS